MVNEFFDGCQVKDPLDGVPIHPPRKTQTYTKAELGTSSCTFVPFVVEIRT
jgi:hypothetical protein